MRGLYSRNFKSFSDGDAHHRRDGLYDHDDHGGLCVHDDHGGHGGHDDHRHHGGVYGALDDVHPNSLHCPNRRYPKRTPLHFRQNMLPEQQGIKLDISDTS